MEYPESYGFPYLALIRKADGKEVYSSLAYFLDNSEVLDFVKIRRTLHFYFERVNSGIKQQLESPRLSEEQKKSLNLLDERDYEVHFKRCVPSGYCQEIIWKDDGSKFFGKIKFHLQEDA